MREVWKKNSNSICGTISLKRMFFDQFLYKTGPESYNKIDLLFDVYEFADALPLFVSLCLYEKFSHFAL